MFSANDFCVEDIFVDGQSIFKKARSSMQKAEKNLKHHRFEAIFQKLQNYKGDRENV